MVPYRSREEPRAPKAAPQTGLVADMVRQFADVHAFVRELVQNGIDAGATALDVTVDRSSEGIASVRVSDDGCGMTMEIIEDALLVLFRSTKDNDSTKIGKYGVGFMSVFAIEPAEVTVDTWRDGAALRLRLFPDHTYEIEHAAPRDRSGTTVALTKPVDVVEFQALWKKVAASLHRWCRHAEIPIQLTVTDAGSQDPPRTARADTPLDVRAAISARQRFDDMEIVVGPIAGSGRLPESGTDEDKPGSFAGFYNRGLTLHETADMLRPTLAAVRVKVNSPRLCHTLSRDDVRRDQAFHLALSRAEKMVSLDLRAAVLRELAKEAEAAGLSGAPDPEGKRTQRLADLLEVATLPPVNAKPSEIVLPLAHAIDGAVAMHVEKIGALQRERLHGRPGRVLATAERTDLTAALAKRGVPIVLVVREAVKDAIERQLDPYYTAAPVAGDCLLVRELTGAERLPGDDVLCAKLSDALARTGIHRVTIGRLPAGDDRVGVIVPEPDPRAASHLVLANQASLTDAWPSGALLVLREGAEAVACARRAAAPVVAAHLLARYLLITGPGLSSKTSEALAIRAIEEIR